MTETMQSLSYAGCGLFIANGLCLCTFGNVCQFRRSLDEGWGGYTPE